MKNINSKVIFNTPLNNPQLEKLKTNNTQKLIFVGRFDELKNVKNIVLSFKNLLNKNVTLDIFGKGPDLNSIKDAIAKNSLENNVKLKGIDLIVDDTEDNISAKIKKYNLIGIPYQIILGSKTPDDAVEFREVGKESQIIKMDKLLTIVKTISDKRN